MVMWLAVIMVCSTLEATTCEVIANQENIFYTLEKCQEDVVNMATVIADNGFFAKPACFKVGEIT
jgi:hypothetical protein